MNVGANNLIGRFAEGRVLRRWSRLASVAGLFGFSDLQAARGRTGALVRAIGLRRATEGRIAEAGAPRGAIEAPVGSDWRWRH